MWLPLSWATRPRYSVDAEDGPSVTWLPLSATPPLLSACPSITMRSCPEGEPPKVVAISTLRSPDAGPGSWRMLPAKRALKAWANALVEAGLGPPAEDVAP